MVIMTVGLQIDDNSDKLTFPFSIDPGNLQYTSLQDGLVPVQLPYLHSVVFGPFRRYPSLH